MCINKIFINSKNQHQYHLRFVPQDDNKGRLGSISGTYYNADGEIMGSEQANWCSCFIGQSDVEPDLTEFHTGDIQVSPKNRGLGSLMMIFGLRIAKETQNASRFYVRSAVNPVWEIIFTSETTEGVAPPLMAGQFNADLDKMITRLTPSAEKHGWAL